MKEKLTKGGAVNNGAEKHERNFLTLEDAEMLAVEFGLQEGDNTLFLKAVDNEGEIHTFHFPKQWKYPRSEKAGGGEFNLKEEVAALKKDLESRGFTIVRD